LKKERFEDIWHNSPALNRVRQIVDQELTSEERLCHHFWANQKTVELAEFQRELAKNFLPQSALRKH